MNLTPVDKQDIEKIIKKYLDEYFRKHPLPCKGKCPMGNKGEGEHYANPSSVIAYT